MDYTRHLTEELALVSTLDPVSQSAATVTSDIVDMSKFRKIIFVLSVGVLGSSATVDFKLTQDTDDDFGGSPKDVSGKAITQLTKAGSDDNKQVIVELRAEELDVQNGYRYVRGSLTVAVASCLISLVALAGVARDKPASADDLASVDEIVTA